MGSQVIVNPTRGDAVLDVYLVRPDSSVTSSDILQGISDHHGVTLEADWEENSIDHQPERFIPVYNRTDVVGLQTFLRDRFLEWAGHGSSVELILNNFKSIIQECVKCFVPHELLKTNSDLEYYTKGIKRMKIKVRKAYNRRKLGTHHMEKLNKLSKSLLAAKKQSQETYLKSILRKEGKC